MSMKEWDCRFDADFNYLKVLDGFGTGACCLGCCVAPESIQHRRNKVGVALAEILSSKSVQYDRASIWRVARVLLNQERACDGT